MVLERVVAITVTYNRSHTLLENIESLISQSYAVEKIIIIDNASNAEHKKVIHDLVKKYHKIIDLLEMEINIGGAGGFEEGLKYAYNKYKSEWYWIMDDDAYPSENCLEKLINSKKRYKNINNIGYLCPLIYGKSLSKYQFYHHKNISRFLNKDEAIYNDYSKINDVTLLQANAFVGPLINKEAIEKVGFPDGSLFIYGDDTEYTYRISNIMNGYLIKDAVIFHEDMIQTDGRYNVKDLWKEYYMYRNRFLFINKFKKNIINKMLGYSLVCSSLLKNIIISAIKIKDKKYVKIKIKLLFYALRDGLVSKSGKTIDPQTFNESIS